MKSSKSIANNLKAKFQANWANLDLNWMMLKLKIINILTDIVVWSYIKLINQFLVLTFAICSNSYFAAEIPSF